MTLQRTMLTDIQSQIHDTLLFWENYGHSVTNITVPQIGQKVKRITITAAVYHY